MTTAPAKRFVTLYRGKLPKGWRSKWYTSAELAAREMIANGGLYVRTVGKAMAVWTIITYPPGADVFRSSKGRVALPPCRSDQSELHRSVQKHTGR